MQITVQSTKYPGYQFGAGMPHLSVGIAQEITPEQKAQIDQEIAILQTAYPEIAAELRFVFSNLETQQPSPVAEGSPVTVEPVAEPAPEPEPEVVLTQEDQELIAIEVEKLDKKNVTEGEALLINTATNEGLSRAVRIAYLDAAIAHKGIQKALKGIAQRLKEQI
ncbi:MAG TPA: hypothetical protein V6C46_05840 [Coleofasciculaceae cyanobacterium]